VSPLTIAIVVVLPDHFRGMGMRRNSAETQQGQQSGHASRFGPEIKDGVPERLRCGTIQELS